MNARIPRTLSLAAALAVALAASPSRADDASFAVDRFQLAPGTSDVLVVAGATFPEQLTVRAALGLQWASSLLVLERKVDRVDLVRGGLAAQLSGAVAFGGRYELGAILPVVLYRDTASGGVLPAASAAGLEDLRLVPKLALPSWHGFRFAASLPFSFPTGKRNALLGEGGMTATPTAIAEREVMGVRVAANLGVAIRPSRRYYDLELGSALVYGLAGEIPFRAGGWGWAVMGNAWGEVGFLDTGVGVRPAEVDAALRWEGPRGIELTGGLGTGVVAGYGAPASRVFVAAGWRPKAEAPPAAPPPPAPPPPAPAPEPPPPPPEPPPAPPPAPPPEPAPPAPEPPKVVDPCAQGEKHEPGQCPDLDDDGDGILNKADKCPTVAGLPEDGGCPPPDPCSKGQKHAPEQCPALDDDEDLIPNGEDRCPLVKGLPEHKGCPPPKAVLTARKIELKEAVYFDVGKASIQERSFQLLDDISRILVDNPQVKLVSIEGHTDSKGNAADNRTLSQQRADAVKTYLVRKGVGMERLDAKGFGPERPVADNGTEAGRAKNRRVEFLVKGE